MSPTNTIIRPAGTRWSWRVLDFVSHAILGSGTAPTKKEARKQAAAVRTAAKKERPA